jgi:hypothetical protein
MIPFAIENLLEGCPFCKGTQFYEGPAGGACINVQCSNCEARFNLHTFDGSADYLSGPTSPQEFYPADVWVDTLVPRPSWIRRLWCWMFGHAWAKWYWGGVNHPFDCDTCKVCYKFRGPMPDERDTPDDFPCTLNPY